jgi:hypothetical protein
MRNYLGMLAKRSVAQPDVRPALPSFWGRDPRLGADRDVHLQSDAGAEPGARQSAASPSPTPARAETPADAPRTHSGAQATRGIVLTRSASDTPIVAPVEGDDGVTTREFPAALSAAADPDSFRVAEPPAPMRNDAQQTVVALSSRDDDVPREQDTVRPVVAASRPFAPESRMPAPAAEARVRQGRKRPVTEPQETVHITIGRIDIRAVPAGTRREESAPPASGPRVTLEEYLAQRNGRSA